MGQEARASTAVAAVASCRGASAPARCAFSKATAAARSVAAPARGHRGGTPNSGRRCSSSGVCDVGCCYQPVAKDSSVLASCSSTCPREACCSGPGRAARRTPGTRGRGPFRRSRCCGESAESNRDIYGRATLHQQQHNRTHLEDTPAGRPRPRT